MNDRVSLRLSSVCREIAATRAALDRARQRLSERRRALEESHLRMLIAETPVADLDLRLAIEEHRRREREVDRLHRRPSSGGARAVRPSGPRGSEAEGVSVSRRVVLAEVARRVLEGDPGRSETLPPDGRQAMLRI